MRAQMLSLLFLGLAACAVGAPEDDVGGRVEWIVDGTRDSTPQVVVLYNARSGGLCTGTLIAPRVVLTAKHCVQQEDMPEPDPPGAFTIGVGDNKDDLTATYRAVEVTATPGPYGARLAGLTGHDIGLLTLQTGISAFPPIDLHRENADDLVGNTIEAVGFGERPDGRAGLKYRAEGRVRLTDGEVLYISPILCHGDSGGPVIDVDSGELVAVNSFITTDTCGGGGIAGTNRVDIFLDLIDEVVGNSGACLNDGDEKCDGFDNDCDNLIDETCLPIGTECSLDEECLGTNCADTPAGRRCTVECDPLRPVLSCETGLYCARTSGCDGLCVPRPEMSTGDLVEGEPCTADLECLSFFCADPGDGNRRCLTPCRGNDGTCYAGEVCAAAAGSCGGCVDEAIVRGLRGLGEGCAEDAECASGACLEDIPGLSYCSAACESDTDCGSATRFHCRDGMCIRGAIGGTGDSCFVNGDCRGELFCASRAGTSWCTTFCSMDNPCPEGFDCTEVRDASLCVPSSGVVGDACTADDDCISGVCDLEAGICSRICGPDAACAGGFECRRTDDGTSAYCVPPTTPPTPRLGGGGCSASGRESGLVPVASLLLFLWGRRRRRRR